MWEEIASDTDSLMIVCFSFVGIVAILVFGICGTLVSLVKHITNTRLKQQMLEQGMTASEIEKVLKAGSEEFKGKWHQNKPPLARKNETGSKQPSKARM
jgi:hypothetical protein